MPGEKLAAETAALPLFRQLENLSRFAIFLDTICPVNLRKSAQSADPKI
jgi:hypothetical protein